jgi:hypothetical protein
MCASKEAKVMNKREKKRVSKEERKEEKKIDHCFFSPLEKNLLIKVILVIENA